MTAFSGSPSFLSPAQQVIPLTNAYRMTGYPLTQFLIRPTYILFMESNTTCFNDQRCTGVHLLEDVRSFAQILPLFPYYRKKQGFCLPNINNRAT